MMRLLLLTIVLTFSHSVMAALNVATWNIERLGQKEQKSYIALAEVLAEQDFVAVQEVMTEQALELLRVSLQERTGDQWESMMSHAVGRGSYKEIYAFLWRTAKVEYVDGAVVYLDRDDKFAREPFSARFRDKAMDAYFVAAQVHIIYGQGEAQRVAEIQELDSYWQWLQSVYEPTTTIMLMGDFNLRPSHAAWRNMRTVATPVVTKGASTLSSHNGRYANLYDNIWVSKSSTLRVSNAHVMRYPELLGWTHEQARRHTSDHAPIAITLTADRAANSQTGAAIQPPPATTQPVALRTSTIHGNKNSMIYHRHDCPSYNAMSSRNRVEFASEQEARSAGYRIAGNCP